MNSKEFEERTIDLERRLERASKVHHKCLAAVVEKFLEREEGYEDVSKHCVDQKKRVDALLKELRNFHS